MSLYVWSIHFLFGRQALLVKVRKVDSSILILFGMLRELII